MRQGLVGLLLGLQRRRLERGEFDENERGRLLAPPYTIAIKLRLEDGEWRYALLLGCVARRESAVVPPKGPWQGATIP